MSTKTFTPAASSPFTKIRAEQIKAELVSGGALSDDLDALKTQVAEIIGGTWNQDVPADAGKVQLLDLAKHIEADAAAGGQLKVLGSLDIASGVTASHAMVEDLNKNGAFVFGSSTGDLMSSYKFQILDPMAPMLVVGLSGSLSASMGVNAGQFYTPGALTVGGAATFNGGVTANQIKISGDTAGHLYYVGGSGTNTNIEDHANLTVGTFNGHTLLTVVGGEVAAVSASFSGPVLADRAQFDNNVAVGGALTVAGNLTVQGTTTTVNSTIVSIADKSFVVASNATAGDVGNDSGFYVGGQEGTELASIKWNETGSKWVASEKLEAAILASAVQSATLLKSNGSGEIIAADAADLDALIDGSGSVGVSVVSGKLVIDVSAIDTDISNLEAALADEVSRAQTAEAALASDLADEVSRAQTAEGVLTDDLAAEVTRATDAEAALASDLADEVTRAMGVEEGLQSQIDALDAAVAPKKAVAKITVPVEATNDMSTEFSGDISFMSSLSAANALIFVNGQLMIAGDDYTLTSSALSFAFGLEAGDVVVMQKA